MRGCCYATTTSMANACARFQSLKCEAWRIRTRPRSSKYLNKELNSNIGRAPRENSDPGLEKSGASRQTEIPQVRPVVVCGWKDGSLDGCDRQSQTDLQQAPGRPVPDQGHRSGEKSTARQRSPNSGASHLGSPTAAADSQNHRRSVQYRTGAGRTRRQGKELGGLLLEQ